MANKQSAHGTKYMKIHYERIRNVTSPEEANNNIFTYYANILVGEIIGVPTTKNLRGFIAAYNDKKRNKVHKAIEKCIIETPDRFINRNSGITITCDDLIIKDKEKLIEFKNPSLINGAQTQGEIIRLFRAEEGLVKAGHDAKIKAEKVEEIRESFESLKEQKGFEPLEFHVRVEIIVDPKPDSVTETAIARNSATSVESISQAGARKYLNELNKRMLESDHKLPIIMTETDFGEGFIQTLPLLQCIQLLMPAKMLKEIKVLEPMIYGNPEKCLARFTEWAEASKNRGKNPNEEKYYDFALSIAPIAYKEYKYWETHSAWESGYRIWEETKKGGRALRKDKNGKVIWVAPGLLFPLINALSAFVVKNDSGEWEIDKPLSVFSEEKLIGMTVEEFRSNNSDPRAMGRNNSTYRRLITYTETIVDTRRKTLEGTKKSVIMK